MALPSNSWLFPWKTISMAKRSKTHPTGNAMAEPVFRKATGWLAGYSNAIRRGNGLIPMGKPMASQMQIPGGKAPPQTKTKIKPGEAGTPRSPGREPMLCRGPRSPVGASYDPGPETNRVHTHTHIPFSTLCCSLEGSGQGILPYPFSRAFFPLR